MTRQRGNETGGPDKPIDYDFYQAAAAREREAAIAHFRAAVGRRLRVMLRSLRPVPDASKPPSSGVGADGLVGARKAAAS